MNIHNAFMRIFIAVFLLMAHMPFYATSILSIDYNHHNAEDIELLNKGFDFFWGAGESPMDRYAAYDCFKKIADRGNVFGFYWMGRMAKDGIVIDKDLQKANYYFDQVFEILEPMAEKGDVLSQLYLGWTYENCAVGDNFKRSAFQWYNKAAMQNDMNACYCVALCYHFGFGVFENHDKYLEWTLRAAELGNNSSMFNMAVENLNNQRIEEGITWLKKAAEAGHAKANYYLASLYLHGDGLSQSFEKALYHYQIGAKKGDVDAAYEMGVYYIEGHGVTKSYKQAAEYWLKGLEYIKTNPNVRQAESYTSGSLEFNLSECYRLGRGVKASKEKEIELLKAAREHGHEKAIAQLKSMGI